MILQIERYIAAAFLDGAQDLTPISFVTCLCLGAYFDSFGCYLR